LEVVIHPWHGAFKVRIIYPSLLLYYHHAMIVRVSCPILM
jgi:hypothetical protein